MDGIVERRIKKRRNRSDQTVVQNTTLVIDTVLMLAAAVNNSASINFVERIVRDLRTMMFMRTMSRDKRNHARDLSYQE
jgi:hypothetical protein